MSHRADSINVAIGYIEEVRRDLSALHGSNPDVWTDSMDLRLRQALDRIRYELRIAPSEEAIDDVIHAQKVA